MLIRLAIVAATLTAALAVAGCEGPYGRSGGGVAVAPSKPATRSLPPNSTPASAVPSAKSLEYAMSIGGTDHDGETLYFVIGVTVPTELEAQKALDAALPRFGDMQSYFIVQSTDKFGGMEPGSWVVVEAYRKAPSAENMQLARRGFPRATVVKATVRTSEPIPVYEDMVDE